MALDPSLALREKVVTALKDDAALLAVISASSIFGEQPGAMPDRPFIRYGVDDIRPNRSSCWQGAAVEFPIHSFSIDPFSDEVRQMNAAVAAALDGATIDLGSGQTARLQWLNSTVMRDAGDPNGWHAIARFLATA